MENKKAERIKFRWESEVEYNYRNVISKVSGKVGQVLRDIDEISKQEKPDYAPVKEEVRKNKNEVKRLLVPECYQLTNDMLLEGYDYYLRAFDILIFEFIVNNDKVNINKINKAATFIEAGNSFMNIVACKNFELFEKQQAEYNERNKN